MLYKHLKKTWNEVLCLTMRTECDGSCTRVRSFKRALCGLPELLNIVYIAIAIQKQKKQCLEIETMLRD